MAVIATLADSDTDPKYNCLTYEIMISFFPVDLTMMRLDKHWLADFALPKGTYQNLFQM